MKKWRYMGEAAGLYLLFMLFRLLPVQAASDFGGWIGRILGPKLAASRKARRNLEQALPGETEETYAHIIRHMWDNLGRTMAEYPHLKQIALHRTEIVNADLLEHLEEDGRPVILFSGHLANWEVIPTVAALRTGLDIALIYRAPNNPYVSRLLDRLRRVKSDVMMISKASARMRELYTHLKAGNALGILIDQKYNEGIPALFLGRPAMTSPAFAELALKFNAHLVPCRCERLKNARFRLTLGPAIDITDDAGQPYTSEQLVETAHRYLEDWIRARPAEWLWLHRRWDSARLKNMDIERL
jgi:KDO2-lipid IV(A) lauroyltransferase